ncbi:MAG: methylated-DNA--[protein]-cysteine S-methyltransferase [Thermoanaerobaculia bacterium]|nr:methylated-DNA--[protein]-cysteine S-methyltransferase [Thermoanaerobaculia bacterium]
MRCENVIRRLDSLRTGELSDCEAATVARHLGLCRPCADSYRDLETLAAQIRGLMGGVPCSCVAAVKAAVGDRYEVVDSPLGALLVIFSAQGVKRITPLAEDAEELAQEYRLECHRELERAPLPAQLRDEVLEAASGSGATSPHVDLAQLAEFRRRVLEVLPTIPVGEVRTYAWVAREAGNPRAVRAVGSACAANPVPFLVPCHRVVPATGGIGAYALGEELKRDLLRREGVAVDRLDELAREGVRYFGYPEEGGYCFPTCGGALEHPEEGLVPLHDEKEAAALGLKPCHHCRPLAA